MMTCVKFMRGNLLPYMNMMEMEYGGIREVAFPVLLENIPLAQCNVIFLQQDGATTHEDS